MDITEIKKIQEELTDLNITLEDRVRERTTQLQDLYDNAPVGYHSLDADGRFIAINQTELDWLGYKQEELIGRHVSTIFDPKSTDTFRNSFPEFKSKGKLERLELSILRRNGTSFWAEVNATAIYNKEDYFLGSRSTLIDITLRRKAEDTMNKAIIEAELANRAKSDFLLNVSHEFRTPLNAVIGFADLIETAGSDERKAYAESIKSSGRRLLTLVYDILDLIRSEKDEIKLENDLTRTSDFFTEIRDEFADKIRDKGLKFISDFSPDLPAFINIDRTRLKQVITNLLDNAVKFTEKGEITFKVITLKHKHNTADTDLVIEVRDTGKGMSDEFQKKMYEVFAQADKKTILSGIGIGLALSQMIVNKMNGSIKVSSQPGMGSSFLITIPVVVSTDALIAEKKPKVERIPPKEEINVDAVTGLDELIEALEGEFHEIIKTFQVRQPIGEVRMFGESLTKLGTIHNCRMISDYGQKLSKEADSFDIEGMLKLIRRYKDVVNSIRN